MIHNAPFIGSVRELSGQPSYVLYIMKYVALAYDYCWITFDWLLLGKNTLQQKDVP